MDTGEVHTIKWSEARLFAIGRAVGRKQHPKVLVYTLVAPELRTYVIWWRLCRPPRWYDTQEPTMPFEQYDQYMQALLSLIADRTGLPLRDLR